MAQTARKRGPATKATGTSSRTQRRRAASDGSATRKAATAAKTAAGTSPARTLPMQRSVDVAAPIDVAWAEWEQLGFIPEGTHRIAGVERDDDGCMVGHVQGLHVERDWEAEILDEREEESFAWRSVGGSDVSGLVTFHPLAGRLTRVELHLDVIPSGIAETLELVTRVADRRAEAELRRFKADVETLEPDEYPDLEDQDEEE
jgi:uncharacterized membrane protein